MPARGVQGTRPVVLSGTVSERQRRTDPVGKRSTPHTLPGAQGTLVEQDWVTHAPHPPPQAEQ